MARSQSVLCSGVLLCICSMTTNECSRMVWKCRLSRCHPVWYSLGSSSSGSGCVERGKGYEQAAALTMWRIHAWHANEAEGKLVRFIEQNCIFNFTLLAAVFLASSLVCVATGCSAALRLCPHMRHLPSLARLTSVCSDRLRSCSLWRRCCSLAVEWFFSSRSRCHLSLAFGIKNMSFRTCVNLNCTCTFVFIQILKYMYMASRSIVSKHTLGLRLAPCN